MATFGVTIVEVVVAAPTFVAPAAHGPPTLPISDCTRLAPGVGDARHTITALPLPDGSSATAGSNIAVPPFVKVVSVVNAPAGERDTTCMQALAVPVHGAVVPLSTQTTSA